MSKKILAWTYVFIVLLIGLAFSLTLYFGIQESKSPADIRQDIISSKFEHREAVLSQLKPLQEQEMQIDNQLAQTTDSTETIKLLDEKSHIIEEKIALLDQILEIDKSISAQNLDSPTTAKITELTHTDISLKQALQEQLKYIERVRQFHVFVQKDEQLVACFNNVVAKDNKETISNIETCLDTARELSDWTHNELTQTDGLSEIDLTASDKYLTDTIAAWTEIIELYKAIDAEDKAKLKQIDLKVSEKEEALAKLREAAITSLQEQIFKNDS